MLAGATWVRPSGIARAAFSGTPTVCMVSCRASVSGAPAMQAVVSTNVGSSTASCLTVARWTSTTGAYFTRITGRGGFRWASSPPSYAARRQIDTNLFGPLWVTQAALPVLRGQGSGHIIQVSSVGGVFALPGLGLYHASKWGLEGMTSSLAMEVRPFGVKVTLVEPAGFATDWQGASADQAEHSPAYAEFRANLPVSASARRGDPDATAAAILAIADADEPPLRVFLGDQPLPLMRAEYARRITEWEAWDDLSGKAFG